MTSGVNPAYFLRPIFEDTSHVEATLKVACDSFIRQNVTFVPCLLFLHAWCLVSPFHFTSHRLPLCVSVWGGCCFTPSTFLSLPLFPHLLKTGSGLHKYCVIIEYGTFLVTFFSKNRFQM